MKTKPSNYGIPYMGSKAKIIPSLAMFFPGAENFYDLFGGGFSVTHYMAWHKSYKFKYFHYNEIKKDVVELVKKAINGDFNYNAFKPKWISRQEFFEKKDKDAYIRCIWSFGNNQKDYLFGPDIEHYKKSMHQAVVFDEFDDLATEVLKLKKWPKNYSHIKTRRLYLRQIIEHYRKTKIPKILYPYLSEAQTKQLQRLEHLERLQQLKQLQHLQQLEHLQQLQQLQRLEHLERINFYSKSYDEVEIPPNSVVYCDIPYKNTTSYLKPFDREKFLNWAATRKFPVYISEYEINDKRFDLVYEAKKRQLFSSIKKDGTAIEKLYWNKVSIDK